jgi:ribosomal protein S18 acetylase RimI-like enzyme
MSAEVTVHFVGVERAETVRALMLAAFAEYTGLLTVPSSAMDETVEVTAAHIAAGGAVLAEVAGEFVGSGRFELREDHVYIGRLSVLPAQRGRGVGALMMTAMEQHAAARGATEARISVRTMLSKNIELYERLGYVVMARYKHDRGAEFVVDMVKKLA